MINDHLCGVRRVSHRRVAKRDHDLARCIGYESYRRADDHCESALASGEETSHVKAVLRQQMLQAVARHLPVKAPELGADGAKVRLDNGLQGSKARVVITVRACHVKSDLFARAG